MNRGRDDVGEAFFSGKVEVVNLCLESPLGLGGSSAERDKVATARDIDNAEALGLEPVGEFFDVIRAEAETVGVLFGREPLVVERRAAILLLREKAADGLLLAGAGHGEQRHVAEFERRIGWALVILRLSLEWNSSRKLDELLS